MLHIVTDGAADLPAGWSKEYCIDSVMHARDIDGGQAMLEEAKNRFNVKDLVMSDLSISLAINFGPGTIGLVLYPAV
jgi:fatty acid-binding protein DegV